jgi:positive regulator of sigma E activity
MDIYFLPICIGMMLAALLKSIIFETPEAVIIFGISCVVFLLTSFIQKNRRDEMKSIRKEIKELKELVANISLRF